MNNLLVICHSVTGTTRELARAVVNGASKHVKAELFEIDSNHVKDGRYKSNDLAQHLDSATSVIFGSPTFMGGPSAQFKAFADFTSEFWAEQRWKDKLASGFTIGLNPSGDQLSTIDYLRTFSAQHGMLWVSIDLPGNVPTTPKNRSGCQSGLVAWTNNGVVDVEDLFLAEYLGERVARLSAKV